MDLRLVHISDNSSKQRKRQVLCSFGSVYNMSNNLGMDNYVTNINILMNISQVPSDDDSTMALIIRVRESTIHESAIREQFEYVRIEFRIVFRPALASRRQLRST